MQAEIRDGWPQPPPHPCSGASGCTSLDPANVEKPELSTSAVAPDCGEQRPCSRNTSKVIPACQETVRGSKPCVKCDYREAVNLTPTLHIVPDMAVTALAAR